MKIVINRCFGGFSLSEKALEEYKTRKGISEDIWSWGINRDDPDLINIVESMGAAANGGFAKLKIVEIPDDVEWQIEEYDGLEHIAEQHRTWS